MKTPGLSLSVRRLVVFGGAALWTLAACWFLLPQLFQQSTTDRLDLIANAVFVFLMFTGSFNFILYLVGFDPNGICDAGV